MFIWFIWFWFDQAASFERSLGLNGLRAVALGGSYVGEEFTHPIVLCFSHVFASIHFDQKQMRVRLIADGHHQLVAVCLNSCLARLR